MVIAAVVVGGAAVAGAAISSHGAKEAANTQVDAAHEAASVGAANAQHAADVRVDAIGKSTDQKMTGLNDSQRITNDTISAASAAQTDAINKSTDQLTSAAQQAQAIYEAALHSGSQTQIETAKQVMDQKIAAANAATAAITEARTQASAKYRQNVDEANTGLKTMYETNKGMYDPYVKAGTDANQQLSDGTKAGGDFNRSFTLADFVKDPGYDFRMQQGVGAVENSALAKGGLLSGNTLKAVTDYGQNFASNEYQNAYGRFNTDMGNRFSRLSSLADRGLTATGSVANLGAQYSRDAAGNIILAGKYAADGIAENGVTTGNGLRDIGGYQAANTQTAGDVTAREQYTLGDTRAALTNGLASLNADRTVDLGNVNTASINATGRNNADYATGSAGIQSQGTLAIGSAKADGINGVNTATVDGINAAGNAKAAGEAATGQIWNNGLNRAANTFTSFYAMNQRKV